MRRLSPAQRDSAQRRVRAITMGSAAAAGVLTLVGAAITAGTFGGRTVATAASTPTPAPTADPSTGLAPPTQPPGVGSGVGSSDGSSTSAPIVSGGS